MKRHINRFDFPVSAPVPSLLLLLILVLILQSPCAEGLKCIFCIQGGIPCDPVPEPTDCEKPRNSISCFAGTSKAGSKELETRGCSHHPVSAYECHREEEGTACGSFCDADGCNSGPLPSKPNDNASPVDHDSTRGAFSEQFRRNDSSSDPNSSATRGVTANPLLVGGAVVFSVLFVLVVVGG